MDLEEWEYLTNDGFLDFDDFYDHKERKTHMGNKNLNPKSLLNMDYFSPDPPRIIKELAPIKIQPPPPAEEKSEANTFPSTPTDPSMKLDGKGSSDTETDHESGSGSGQFVDMKVVESSKGCSLSFDDDDDDDDEDEDEVEEEMMISARKKEEDGNGGVGVWKWSLSGIRAICSFGVAAATVCIIVLGNNQKNKHHNQKIRFQIYADDKMVQQATKMNEAISAVRGAQIASANISFGGYYNAL